MINEPLQEHLNETIRDHNFDPETRQIAYDLANAAVVFEARPLVKLVLELLDAKDAWLIDQQSQIDRQRFSIKAAKNDLNRYLDDKEPA